MKASAQHKYHWTWPSGKVSSLRPRMVLTNASGPLDSVRPLMVTFVRNSFDGALFTLSSLPYLGPWIMATKTWILSYRRQMEAWSCSMHRNPNPIIGTSLPITRTSWMVCMLHPIHVGDHLVIILLVLVFAHASCLFSLARHVDRELQHFVFVLQAWNLRK